MSEELTPPENIEVTASPDAPAAQPTTSTLSPELVSKQIEAVNNNTQAITSQIDNLKEHKQNEMIDTAKRKLNKMMVNDSSFSELIENADPSKVVPDAVSIDLVTQFDEDTAKSVLTELLTDDLFHLRMENAYMKGNEAYHKWVNKLFSYKSSKQKEKPAPEVPELVSEETGGTDDFSNVDAYLNSLPL